MSIGYAYIGGLEVVKEMDYSRLIELSVDNGGTCSSDGGRIDVSSVHE